jgi:hypothetical protein
LFFFVVVVFFLYTFFLLYLPAPVTKPASSAALINTAAVKSTAIPFTRTVAAEVYALGRNGFFIKEVTRDDVCSEEEGQSNRWLSSNCSAWIHALSAVLHGAGRVELNEEGLDYTLGTHDMFAGVNLLRALGWILACHHLLTGRAAVVSEPSLCRRPQIATLLMRITANLVGHLLLFKGIKTTAFRRRGSRGGAWSAQNGERICVHLGSLGMILKRVLSSYHCTPYFIVCQYFNFFLPHPKVCSVIE